MSNLWVNNGGTWTSVKQPYVNNGGTYTPTKAVWVNNDGTWVQVHFSFITTISSNTTNYNLRTAAISAGWSGSSKLNAIVTINSGVTINGTGNNTSSAFIVDNIVTGSTVTINNNGTVVGLGGAVGSVAAGGLTAQSYPGNYNGALVKPNYTNGWDGSGYPLGPGAGGSTPGYNYYPGSPYSGGNGGNGGNGGTALYLASNVTLVINNAGTFVGGGGGAGGQAFNNSGGGRGGDGGYMIEETGTHPAIIANNSGGAVLASGGGASGGWGNRYEGDGIGGGPGYSGRMYLPTGGGSGGAGNSPGLATNNTGTTVINSAGTFTLSPAR